MARPLRLEFPGALYHLTARGNARENIYHDDTDRRHFLDLLGREIGQQGWKCYAYCLMNNHYHLLIETPQANLVQGMRRLNGVYTQAFNRRHHRVGHVFQGRYKSILVDRDSYLLELCRYIVLNPVRAQVVSSVRDWPWSSYRGTAGFGRPPDWLETEGVLAWFGRERKRAQLAYRRFVAAGALSPWGDLRGQIWLGHEDFLRRAERWVRRQRLDNVPASQSRPMQPRKETVIKAVAHAYGVPLQAVFDRSHQRTFQAVVYLLRRAANLSLKEVAELAAVSPPRISQIQRTIEQRKPDKRLRRLMNLYKVKN